MQFKVHGYWHKLVDFDIMFHKELPELVEADSQSDAYRLALDGLDPIIDVMRSEWNFLNWVVVPLPLETLIASSISTEITNER